MMDLMAHRTRDRLIDMAVLGGVFGGKALNAVSGCRAAVYEERHAILNKSQLEVFNYGCLPSVRTLIQRRPRLGSNGIAAMERGQRQIFKFSGDFGA